MIQGSTIRKSFQIYNDKIRPHLFRVVTLFIPFKIVAPGDEGDLDLN